MSMDFDADLATMLRDDEHADLVVFTPKGYPHPSSKSSEIAVIFERQYLEVGNVAGFFPTALGSTTEFEAAGIDVGANATIKGVGYSVIEAQPDGTGMTLMVLQRT